MQRICFTTGLFTTKENKVSIIVEIRAAEGGDDSKLLVEDQVSIYTKVAAREYL